MFMCEVIMYFLSATSISGGYAFFIISKKDIMRGKMVDTSCENQNHDIL